MAADVTTSGGQIHIAVYSSLELLQQFAHLI